MKPVDGTFLPSSSRTTTQTQQDQMNEGHRGLRVVVDVTTPGTGSITVTIDELDQVSGKYVTLLTSAALTTTATTVLRVFPGATVTANASANDTLGATWRIKVTHNNANAITYSVGFVLLP